MNAQKTVIIIYKSDEDRHYEDWYSKERCALFTRFGTSDK